MEVDFARPNLERLEVDGGFAAGLAPETVKAYRRRVQQIRAAPDERVLTAIRSMGYEPRAGARGPQWTIRLRGHEKLIMEKKAGDHGTVIVITGIEV